MTPPYADDVAPAAPALSPPEAARRRMRPPRRTLVLALVLSVALHLVLSVYPIEPPGTPPEEQPLQATITELPPPPVPTPAPEPPPQKAKPKPKPKRVAPPPVKPAAPEPPAIVAETPGASETPPAAAEGPPAPTEAPPAATQPEVASVDSPPLPPDTPPRELPPRLDLAYKVFLGTQGFMIGEATYRFEHTGNQYRIVTVGEAKGLAALLIRGQGRVESRGFITSNGLQPQEFSVERGSPDRREIATFDWETGIVTLHEQKTAELEPSTYDPLALMWQYYFAPPAGDVVSFSIATTRRVFRYTISREGHEKIEWGQGEIDTELWHRKSDDGRIDSYVWLAPSLHYVPVKLRVVATNRGTLEALLESIRIDEPMAVQ